MKTFSHVFFTVMTLIWVSVLIWVFFPLGAPITSLPGDLVYPETVTVGGKIHVVRNLRVIREEPVVVNRAVMRGDCRKTCEIIDLPGGNLTLKVGDYPNVLRDHILPNTVQPGDWRLVFTIQWADRVGALHVEPLTVLAIKVVA